MRDHTKAFCRLVAETFACPGPVYEFGSYQVEGQVDYADLRTLFAGRSYVGCDMRAGPGVDRVEDVSAMSLADGVAGTVLCIETFEHVFEVRRAFDEVYRVLEPGGLFVITSPLELPDPRLSRRLLADDAELPAADDGALRGPADRLSGLPQVPAHGHGPGRQGPRARGLRREGRRAGDVLPRLAPKRRGRAGRSPRRSGRGWRASTGRRASGITCRRTTRPTSPSTSRRCPWRMRAEPARRGRGVSPPHLSREPRSRRCRRPSIAWSSWGWMAPRGPCSTRCDDAG